MSYRKQGSSSKRLLNAALALSLGGAMGAMSLPSVATAAEGADGLKNVALQANGGTVSQVSGNEVPDKWGPENLIDGHIGVFEGKQSRWSSDHNDKAFAVITFKEATKLDHVDLYWASACSTKWDLLVSTDGSSFTKVHSEENQTCAPKRTNKHVKATVGASELGNAKIKAIKLQSQKRAIPWGTSLWEIQAWASADQPEVESTDPGTTVPETPNDGDTQAPPQGPGQGPGAQDPAAPGESADSQREVNSEETIAMRGLTPLPQSITAGEGHFTITKETKIVAPEGFSNEAKLLADRLRASTGYPLQVVTSAEGNGNIKFVKGNVDGMEGDEAYQLVSNNDGVTITAPSAHGVFNGTQTLVQLLPGFAAMNRAVIADWSIPAATIKDAPRFAHRGYMLDISRSFIPADDIKKIVDDMSMYKMTALHLHLADDQGWRIEITNEGREDGDDIDYGQLTKVGSTNAMTVWERQTSHELGRTGFLTQDQWKDIQAYAKARHIELIPEIDFPGHSNAILAAIPQMNTDGSSHPATEAEPTAPLAVGGAVGQSYLDPDNPKTMVFIKHVLKQISEMTESTKFHVGGDESFAFTKRYGEAKYSAFLSDVFQYVRDLGKKPIGWNEVAAGGAGWANGNAGSSDDGHVLKSGDFIQYWTGNTNPTKAAADSAGIKVIASPAAGAYMPQRYNNKTPIGPNWACSGYGWGGDCNTVNFYNWDPAQRLGLRDDQIEGVESALWSEGIRGLDQAQFMSFPRMISNAEIAWTKQDRRDPAEFAKRLGQAGPSLNAMGVQFYDDAVIKWGYDVAGVASEAPTGESTIQLGYVSAPGTKLAADGKTLNVDKDNDRDGVSDSTLQSGSKVMITWGEGEDAETSEATLTPTRERGLYGAPGIYTISAQHNFDSTGDKTVTIHLGDRTAKAKIHVAPGHEPASPLYEAPTVAGPLKATLDGTYVKAGGRIGLNTSGLQPGQMAQITLDGHKLGEIRGDGDGTRNFHLYIPADTAEGPHTIKATQGDNVVTLNIVVWNDRAVGLDPMYVPDVTAVKWDSQENDGPASAALDGNVKTFWHTKWRNGAKEYPHFLEMNLNHMCKLTAFEYTARQDNINTRVKDFKLYVSQDGEDWGDAVMSKALSGSTAPQLLKFDTPVSAKYVKFEALSAQSDQRGHREFAGAAEIKFQGDCEGVEPTTLNVSAGDKHAATHTADAAKLAVEDGQTVKLQVTGVKGHVTLWQGEGDNPEFVEATEAEDGSATFSTTAKLAQGDKHFSVVTENGRLLATIHVVEKATEQPDPNEGQEPAPGAGDEGEEPAPGAGDEGEEPAPGAGDEGEQPELNPDKLGPIRTIYAPQPWYAPFDDVTVGTQFAGEIDWLRYQGITTGWDDGTFRPWQPITREAMAAFLYRLAGSPEHRTLGTTFSDVDSRNPFYREISWLSREGITRGWDDGTFHPHEYIQRNAMAAFLYRFCERFPGRCAEQANPKFYDGQNAKFSDITETSPFAREIGWMDWAGISTGWADRSFRPYEPITRGAMAAFLYRTKFDHR